MTICGCLPDYAWFSTYGFNKICFFLHLIFGLILLIESIGEFNVGGYSTDVKLTYNSINATNWPDRVYVVKEFGSFNICAVLAAFSLITSAFHLWYMSAFESDWLWWFNPVDIFYATSWDIEAGTPGSIEYRMVEYSVTASLMILVITVLFGLRDVFILLAVFFLMMSTMFFGALQSWTTTLGAWPHIFGWVPYIPAWGIIIAYFAILVNENANVPDFVWAVLIIEILMFSCFGVVQLYYDAWPKFQGLDNSAYIRREDGLYNFFSLVSKILLVSILYFNFYGLEQNP